MPTGSVAQLNRASDFGSDGYRFESCRGHKQKFNLIFNVFIMKRYIYLLLVSVFAVGLSEQVQGQEILEKTWSLTAIGKEKVRLDTAKTPYISLSAGRLSGFSACNRMIGSYVLDGNILTFNGVGGTKMLCFDAQELEDKFLKTLGKTHFWKLKRKQLQFLDENKKVILRFKIKA